MRGQATALDTRTLQTLVEVARSGSFSKAARLLGVSQPAVSQQIQVIEEVYQAQLINRAIDGCTLTEAGQIVFAYAQKILALERDSLDDVRNVAQRTPGSIAVGSVFAMARHLPSVLAKFKATYPAINLRLYIGATLDVLARLRDGELDLAVTPLPDARAGSLASEAIAEYRLVLCAAPQHPVARLGRVAIQDLKDLPLIMRESGAQSRDRLEETLRRVGARGATNQLMEVSNLDTVRVAVQAGLGVSFFPEVAVTDELRNGSLVRVETPDLDMRLTLYVSVLKERYRSAALQDLARMAADDLRSAIEWAIRYVPAD